MSNMTEPRYLRNLEDTDAEDSRTDVNLGWIHEQTIEEAREEAHENGDHDGDMWNRRCWLCREEESSQR